MKKLFIPMLALSLTSLSAFADCRQAISKGEDTHATRFFIDHDIRSSSTTDTPGETSIRLAMQEVGCTPAEIAEIKFTSESCSYLKENTPASFACYVETTMGYYYVTQDLQMNITVTFNK